MDGGCVSWQREQDGALFGEATPTAQLSQSGCARSDAIGGSLVKARGSSQVEATVCGFSQQWSSSVRSVEWCESGVREQQESSGGISS